MRTEDLKHHERRIETRYPAEGDVTLRQNGSALSPGPGRLVDIAKSGFRAQHRSPTLRSGDIVEFEFAGANGRARVVWTRILGENVESGFLILTEHAGPVSAP